MGGALAALAMDQLAKSRRGLVLQIAACVIVAVVAAAAGIAVSGRDSPFAG